MKVQTIIIAAEVLVPEGSTADVQAYASRAAQRLRHTEQPGFAVGAAIGAVIPSTPADLWASLESLTAPPATPPEAT